MSRDLALQIAARSTVAEAAKAAGVHPATVLRWCKKAGVTPAHTLKYPPGVAGYVDGCRCDVCTAAVKRLPRAEYLYVSGHKDFDELGQMLGVSAERVRQWLDMWLGGFEYRGGRRAPKSGAAFEARRAERVRQEVEAARRAEEALAARARAEGVTCRVCGADHHRKIRGEWGTTCSPECAEMWTYVRLFHNDHHDRHAIRIAQWDVDNPDKITPAKLATSKRRLAGEGPTYDGVSWASREATRWLQVGSRSWDIACRAYREEWPTFAEWPEDIQNQIREHFRAVSA